MLTPKEIKNAPSEIEALFLSLEEEVMRAFGEGLKARGKVKGSDLYAIEVLEG